MEHLGSEIGVREEQGLVKPEPPEFDWMVMFIDTDEKLKWWDYLFHTRKGFRHVCAIGYQPGSYHWIFMDWTSKFFQTWIYHPLAANDVLKWAKTEANATIVSYRPRRDKNSVFNFSILYCVQAVKHLLGIKGLFVLTPWQLYKEMMSCLLYTSPSPRD